ncbi:MAG: LysR family transcriptional regulator [Firmicutes bacterium]|nr:LysR family transcriptional regulator [Bacillota bacterium]
MDLLDIAIFRSLLNSRSVSQTSQMLLLPQSTISQRLARLESELGFPLFLRQKGLRGVEVTEQGLAFADLAVKWEENYHEILSLRDAAPVPPLVVATPESVSSFVLLTFWKKLPELGFYPRVRTHQSNEIYDLIDNRQADAGFVFTLARYASVTASEALRERIVMICRPGGPWREKTVRPQDLDKRKEVFLAWSPQIESWHDSWWKTLVHPLVQVDTPTLVFDFLAPGTWAMCPASIASTHAENGFEVHYFADEPPPRVCYFVRHTSPSQRQAMAVDRFTTLLMDYLASLRFKV